MNNWDRLRNIDKHGRAVFTYMDKLSEVMNKVSAEEEDTNTPVPSYLENIPWINKVLQWANYNFLGGQGSNINKRQKEVRPAAQAANNNVPQWIKYGDKVFPVSVGVTETGRVSLTDHNGKTVTVAPERFKSALATEKDVNSYRDRVNKKREAQGLPKVTLDYNFPEQASKVMREYNERAKLRREQVIERRKQRNAPLPEVVIREDGRTYRYDPADNIYKDVIRDPETGKIQYGPARVNTRVIQRERNQTTTTGRPKAIGGENIGQALAKYEEEYTNSEGQVQAPYNPKEVANQKHKTQQKWEQKAKKSTQEGIAAAAAEEARKRVRKIG